MFVITISKMELVHVKIFGDLCSPKVYILDILSKHLKQWKAIVDN